MLRWDSSGEQGKRFGRGWLFACLKSRSNDMAITAGRKVTDHVLQGCFFLFSLFISSSNFLSSAWSGLETEKPAASSPGAFSPYAFALTVPECIIHITLYLQCVYKDYNIFLSMSLLW
ncbi:hypothetical protein BJX65DRAFT_284351 [Aspergillus insuetus]